MTEWDPEHPETRPRWRPRVVAEMLGGLETVSNEREYVQGGESGRQYPAEILHFVCGCVASDRSGWISCGHGLHVLLAGRAPDGRIARQVRALRPAFDAVLREAWKRRGTEPAHYYQFYLARQRDPSLTFEDWQRTHDLAQHPIWRRGSLEADLDKISSEGILLFNGGHGGNPTILLRWKRRSGQHDVDLPPSPEKAIEIVYGSA